MTVDEQIQEQILWEHECIRRGSDRYYAQQDRLKSSGQGDQADNMSLLLRDRIEDVALELETIHKTTVGKGAGTNWLLDRALVEGDYHRLAFIGMKVVFQVMLMPRNNTVLKICLDIASRLEADVKCIIFEAMHPNYYAVVNNSFKTQKVKDYKHRHKVMMLKYNEFDIGWHDWTQANKAHIGSKVLLAIMNVFDDIIYVHKQWERGKGTAILKTTEEFEVWTEEFEKVRSIMHPFLLPLKIPPRAWTQGKGGGYYTPQMTARLPFVKTRGKAHTDYVKQHPMEHHTDAINKMQRTAWKVNNEVLEVQKLVYEKGLKVGIPSSQELVVPSFPEHLKSIEKDTLTEAQRKEVSNWKARAKAVHGKEQERKGQVLAFMQSHALAKELEDWEEFYFAYNADFRGRIYCATSGLSPQGADAAKGLLQFAKGVELGESGVYWLAVQGANTYGNDKLKYDDRVQWVMDNEDYIHRVVDDPISAREFWGNADKPYQFLAFCFEWARSDYGRDPKTKGYLPVGLDGSCNGLQHFSAMLRDDVGAKATNLCNSELPSDIYQDVADVCMKKLQAEFDDCGDARAKIWLRVGVNRKCAKRPVMTLPYGATQESARHYIMEYVQANWGKFNLSEKHQWEFAVYLTPILWESIGEVVVAARAAMSWLKKCVGPEYSHWVTPLGFPVYQYYKKVESILIATMLNGSLSLSLKDVEQPGLPNSYAQKNGVSPNFVHSIDSTHMVMTINDTDFHSYAMIHDDFGTHAGRTEELFTSIRKTFKELYTKYDPLQEWAEQVGKECPLIKGVYDINDITDAAYFFG
jgi:DNA-directed RNA polymerase|tara:strand:- start:11820 stop:14237 length:2418 start_codon:yes stop_codon:yes gene_type:complete